jgi:hypothetical protein
LCHSISTQQRERIDTLAQLRADPVFNDDSQSEPESVEQDKDEEVEFE